MKRFSGYFILLLFFLFWLLPAAPVLAQIQESLKKIQDRQSLSPDEAVKVAREVAKEVVRNHRQNRSPTRDAELYYQLETNNKPCPHCPEYLKLIREVNKIVEKLPQDKTESVALHNESLIQLNRLKFMYYEIKAVQENGDERCQIYMHHNPLNPEGIPKDSLILLAEEALELPHITSFQYLPRGKEKAISYFYRGEGSQSHIIIEVMIYPDQRAVVRYHYYKRPGAGADERLPGLGSVAPSRTENRSTFDLVDETEFKSKMQIADDINMTSETKAHIDKQTMKIAIGDASGTDWVKVDVRHQTLRNVGVTTVLPVEWKVDESGLKVGSSVSYETVVDYVGGDNRPKETATVNLSLTDHNHEYFKARFVDKKEVDELILSTRYSLGKSESIDAVATSDSRGRKSYSMGHRYSWEEGSSVSTRVGMSPDARRYFELQNEKRISDTTSMVFSVKTDDQRETSVMYQFKMILK